MKGRYAISRFEFHNVRTHAVHHSRDVVPRVKAFPPLLRQRHFIVLRIRAGDDNFNHDLIRFRDWYRGFNDLDLWARSVCRDNGFLHLVRISVEEESGCCSRRVGPSGWKLAVRSMKRVFRASTKYCRYRPLCGNLGICTCDC